MPVFNDSNNVPALLTESDYTFCVVGFEIGVSNGPSTRGSEKYLLDLEIEPSGKHIDETLIDHPKTGWKIDCFLKASGVQIPKGQAFEFQEDKAKSNNVPWVNPLGLRGWCRVVVEEYTRKDGAPGKANKVAVFYTDKPKLPKRVIEIPEEERPF